MYATKSQLNQYNKSSTVVMKLVTNNTYTAPDITKPVSARILVLLSRKTSTRLY